MNRILILFVLMLMTAIPMMAAAEVVKLRCCFDDRTPIFDDISRATNPWQGKCIGLKIDLEDERIGNGLKFTFVNRTWIMAVENKQTEDLKEESTITFYLNRKTGSIRITNINIKSDQLYASKTTGQCFQRF